jgi:hypothetical protein
MNKRKLSLLLISTLLTASVSIAAEKSPKKKVEAVLSATPPVLKTVIKPWEPTAFDLNADRLPPDYTGLDPIKFFEVFKSKIESVKKGEFETSEEFRQRTSNLDSLLSPINTTDIYAFRIPKITYKYDADAQAYFIGGNYGYSCKETYSFGQYKDWVMCEVSPIFRDIDTYVGSNAYGASSTVKRTRGSDFAVAITKKFADSSAVLTRDRLLKELYQYQDRLIVPLEKARDLKDMKISVLFVGRITDAKIIEGRGVQISPKIDSPTDLRIKEEGVPFELKKIVYYVVQTGEILGQVAY